MSVVFHGFRIEKYQLWHLVDDLRKHAIDHDQILSQFKVTDDNVQRVLEEKRKYETEHAANQEKTTYFSTQHDRMRSTLSDDQIKGLFTSSLQLFDDGQHWIFRVLTIGYFFENYLWKMKGYRGLEDFSVDTRTDPPDDVHEHVYVARVRRVEEGIDSDIKNRRYFVVPLVDDTMVMDFFWALHAAAGKVERERKGTA